MRVSQFKGFLLEDIVAYLLKRNDFNLLTKNEFEQWPEKFILHGNGHSIRGRGGEHQFDTLGDFKWNIPFINPIRLFVEAKFNKKPVSINVARNGIALISDINQNLTTISMNSHDLSLPKYNYHYAIFSASGFADTTIRMALAHNIMLVDLSGNNYKFILDNVNSFIASLSIFNNNDKNADTINISSEFIGKNVGNYIRGKIRESLFEIPLEENDRFEIIDNRQDLNQCINEFCTFIRATEKFLYLANTGGAYTLVMVDVEEGNFIESMREIPNQEVEITWNDGSDRDLWIVTNRGFAKENDITEFRLEFNLPKVLMNYVFRENEHNYSDTAATMKENNFNNINIVISLDENDNLLEETIICTLKYNASRTEVIISENI